MRARAWVLAVLLLGSARGALAQPDESASYYLQRHVLNAGGRVGISEVRSLRTGWVGTVDAREDTLVRMIRLPDCMRTEIRSGVPFRVSIVRAGRGWVQDSTGAWQAMPEHEAAEAMVDLLLAGHDWMWDTIPGVSITGLAERTRDGRRERLAELRCGEASPRTLVFDAESGFWIGVEVQDSAGVEVTDWSNYNRVENFGTPFHEEVHSPGGHVRVMDVARVHFNPTLPDSLFAPAQPRPPAALPRKADPGAKRRVRHHSNETR